MRWPHASPGGDLQGSAGERRQKRGAQTLQFFTLAETAEMLRVSTRTVRRWIDSGKLVAHRPGGVVRIGEADLRAFLALHREG